MGSINTELQDVQRIMVANIEEVLQRGEALSGKYSNKKNLSSSCTKHKGQNRNIKKSKVLILLYSKFCGQFVGMLHKIVRFPCYPCESLCPLF